jgi:hypothetical protein
LDALDRAGRRRSDDFGRVGRSYRETDVETADLETTITDLLGGQYSNPIRVVAFNTAEKWSQDASGDIAQEILSMRHVGGLFAASAGSHAGSPR